MLGGNEQCAVFMLARMPVTLRTFQVPPSFAAKKATGCVRGYETE